MNGLIVLVPYTGGQDFYTETDEDENYYEYENEVAKQDEYEQEQGSNLSDNDDVITKEEDEYEKENDNFDDSNEVIEAYLPVYVETESEDLALMAVAYAACVKGRYVACPANWRAKQEWEERNYPGTLNSPGVELPHTEEAFEIPEPGDCFCCASLEDYEVYSLKDFREMLEMSKTGYLMSVMEDDEDLWQQFDEWCVRILNYHLLNQKIDGLIENLDLSNDDELSWLD